MEEKEDVEAAEAITFALGSAPEKCELACGHELNTRQQLLSAGAGGAGGGTGSENIFSHHMEREK